MKVYMDNNATTVMDKSIFVRYTETRRQDFTKREGKPRKR